jgi:predicted enzyme related to lactoylglutathione lyase
MNTIATLVQNVSDLESATTLWRTLLGTEPHTTTAYYVGFNVGGLEIGLAPAGAAAGAAAPGAPVPFAAVEDIEAALAALIAAGATAKQSPTEVGGGTTIATVTEQDGATLGLIHRAG